VLAVIPRGRARGLRIVFSHTRTFLLAGAASTVAFATILAARKRESAAEIFVRCSRLWSEDQCPNRNRTIHQICEADIAPGNLV
jgi:hypothetical protein